MRNKLTNILIVLVPVLFLFFTTNHIHARLLKNDMMSPIFGQPDENELEDNSVSGTPKDSVPKPKDKVVGCVKRLVDA